MSESEWPQAGRERLIVPAPVGITGTGMANPEKELMRKLDERHVMMMGDNPALARFPAKPTLLDFFKLRLQPVTARHLLTSAARAAEAGQSEKVVLACLLHDISNGALIRSDHGYWGAQMIAPYVDEEVAWAVKYHQALRYFPDESVGYDYPESYHRFFGADYTPPAYLRRDAEYARGHRWYMTSRLITLYDIYFSTIPLCRTWSVSKTSSGGIFVSLTKGSASTLPQARICGGPSYGRTISYDRRRSRTRGRRRRDRSTADQVQRCGGSEAAGRHRGALQHRWIVSARRAQHSRPLGHRGVLRGEAGG
jgi:hypothetical protein